MYYKLCQIWYLVQNVTGKGNVNFEEISINYLGNMYMYVHALQYKYFTIQIYYITH